MEWGCIEGLSTAAAAPNTRFLLRCLLLGLDLLQVVGNVLCILPGILHALPEGNTTHIVASKVNAFPASLLQLRLGLGHLVKVTDIELRNGPRPDAHANSPGCRRVFLQGHPLLAEVLVNL